MLSRFRTPIYKNTGSVARDHLASERTFLAWIRTGLGFVALGIAVERFSQLDLTTPQSHAQAKPQSSLAHQETQEDNTQVLVGGLMVTGSSSIVYGVTRYFSNMRQLERGFYKPSFYGAGFLTMAVFGVTGLAYRSINQSSKDQRS